LEAVIIVEGKNDYKRLRRLLKPEIQVICTYGTPSQSRMEKIKKQVAHRLVFIFTDHDTSGKKIRALLSDEFPDAAQLYTKKGYAGVEGTPEEHIISQLEKQELHAYIIYPLPDENF